MATSRRHGALLLSLLSLVSILLLSSVSLSSAQSAPSVMNFCYYMQQDAATPAWTISASGSMTVTGPTFNSNFAAVYQVVGITGVRTQTGTGASTVYITGLSPTSATQDNTLSTQWPFLKGGTANGNNPGGIGYTVSTPVTVPTASAATSTIQIVSHPVNELPLTSVSSSNAASGLTGLSYFVYQPASAGVPNCNPASAVPYSFQYTVSPTYNATGTSSSGSLYQYGDWSACVQGNLSVVGPFAIPSFTGSGTNNVLAVVGATGTRYITATRNFVAQTSTITGVGPDDGGDFMFYGQGSVVSDAGITFRYSSSPSLIMSSGAEAGNSNYQYLNIWATGVQSWVINEANAGLPPPIEQQVVLPFPQPYGANPLVDNFRCPATVLTQAFGFCYYGEGVGGPSTWTVSMYGTLLAAPEISGSGHWFITSAVGTRVQTVYMPSTVQITGLGPITNDSGTSLGSLDNQISSSYPFLSTHGLSFLLSANVNQPAPAGGGTAPAATKNVFLINDPPCELGTCSTGQYAQGWSTFVLFPNTLNGAGVCGTPGTTGGLPTIPLNFGYIATPRTGPNVASNNNGAQPAYFNTSTAPAGKGCTASFATSSNLACPVWSACVSATLTAVGPLSLPGPTSASNIAYAFSIYGATGSRNYYDVTGAMQTVQINNVVYQDGADQVLYFTAPYVDDAGLTFGTSAVPMLAFPDGEATSFLEPGQTQTTYINLWSAQQGGTTYGVTATESTYSEYPDNTAQMYWGVATATTLYGVTLPVLPAFTCPAATGPAYTLLNFCIFISAIPGQRLTSGVAAVAYGGQFIASPQSPTSSQWVVSGVTGTRTTYAVSPYGSGTATAQPALTTQTLSSINSGDGNNILGNNVLGQQYPIIGGANAPSSPAPGLTFVVTNPAGTSPASQQIQIQNNPPSESLESWSGVDTSYIVYTAGSDTSLGSCPPVNTQILAFSYTAKPASASDDPSQGFNTNPTTGAQWSSCMTGALQVIGPYTYLAANGQTSRSAYVVLGATGARTFVDINGTAWTTWVTGANNGVGGGSAADGADMLLYTQAPYVDGAGITFEMSGPPQWPNSLDPSASQSLQQLDYINLWFQGLSSGFNGPTEAVITPTPYNYVSFSMSAYTAGSTQLVQCPQGPNLNNFPLSFGTGPTGNVGNTNGGSSSSSSPDHSLSNGQVAGIAVGVTLAFIILLGLAICLTMALMGGRGKSSGASSGYNGESSRNANTNAAPHVQMEESRTAETA